MDAALRKAADSTPLTAHCTAVGSEVQGRKGFGSGAAAAHPVFFLFSQDGKKLFHLLKKQLCCRW